jgi:hypothetical protein
MLKFTQVYVLKMGTVLFLVEVCEWLEMLKKCRTSVTDAECVGCPATPTINEKLKGPEPWFSRLKESLSQEQHKN